MSRPLFLLQNVCKTRCQGPGYELRIPSLRIHQGDCIALTGASGCGKSTVLDILGMVLAVDGEKFCFASFDILQKWRQGSFDHLASIRLTEIGYVLQTGGLLPFLSVGENIQLRANLLKIGDRVKSTEKLAAMLGIQHLLEVMPDRLSIGERQRVAIAQALLSKPPVVLADEPTAALDPYHADAVLDIFFKAVKESGTTLILATHDRRIVDQWDLKEMPIRVERRQDSTSVAILESHDSAESISQKPLSVPKQTSSLCHTLALTVFLALRDWMHEKMMTLCSILSLVSALVPILILLGIRNGIVQTLENRLLENPSLLTITPAGSGIGYTQKWLQDHFANRSDVAFVIPEIRSLSSTVQMQSAKGFVSLDLEPTAKGDPLLERFQAVPVNTASITLSTPAAEKLGVKVGDSIKGALGRTTTEGKLQSYQVDFRVSAILPLEGESRTFGFILLPILQAMEDYRDGFEIPDWNIQGKVHEEERHFARFRLYAKTMNDVAVLRDFFIQNLGIEVHTNARDIQTFQQIREALTVLFFLIAAAVSAGFAASTTSSVLAAVHRKNRELALLRLLGFPCISILLFPLIQTQATAFCGSLCAGGIQIAVSMVLDRLLAEIFHNADILALPISHFLITGAGVALIAFLASLPAALRATQIEPSEVLRAL